MMDGRAGTQDISYNSEFGKRITQHLCQKSLAQTNFSLNEQHSAVFGHVPKADQLTCKYAQRGLWYGR